MQQEMKLRRRIAGGAMACVLSCGLMVPQLAFATPDSSSKQAEAQAVLASLNSMQYQLDQASRRRWSTSPTTPSRRARP